MAIEASFTIPQHEFPLSGVFEELSGATIELDRVVPTDRAVIPYFWIHSEGTESLETDLSEDQGVDDIAVVDEVEGQYFLRVSWNLDYESVLTAIVNTDVSLLSGIGEADQWTFEVRASDQEAISGFQSYCRENDIGVTLTELHALSRIDSNRDHDLTEGQQRALRLAYSHGYFDTPRNATQQDLADELGISHQAVSSRLQRGIRRLVASTIVTPD